MKKTLLGMATFVLFPLILHAQTVYTSFQSEMESIFAHLDRSPVSSGLLSDYGLLLTDIEKYNGVVLDGNEIEYSEWRLLYQSLYTSRFNSHASGMTAPETIFAAINSSQAAELAPAREPTSQENDVPCYADMPPPPTPYIIVLSASEIECNDIDISAPKAWQFKYRDQSSRGA